MFMNEFLKVRGQEIVHRHRPVILKGVNLGGWLMMEGYILHSPNYAEQKFKEEFKAALGNRALEEFENDFRENFIQASDIQQIARYGFNCIRVPFNHRLIEKSPYHYDPKGLAFLDQVIRWAKENHLWIILDLHAACGSQNHDWHSDSLGVALLWQKKAYQERTLALWEFLAERYSQEETIAGYDFLNEAVVQDKKILNAFYRNLIKRIRNFDSHHILFVEGNTWATDLDCLDAFEDDNIVLSFHAYQPLDFTFNFVPHRKYPSKGTADDWNHKRLKMSLNRFAEISQERNRPLWCGEFGVNCREGLYGEDIWLKDILSVFEEFGFHWTYWTYKAVKNHVFPDGVLSYIPNPPWVNRQGPLTGWQTYPGLWRSRRAEIIRSWQTENFTENVEVLNTLKKFLSP